jgi:hypothetical protein
MRGTGFGQRCFVDGWGEESLLVLAVFNLRFFVESGEGGADEDGPRSTAI